MRFLVPIMIVFGCGTTYVDLTPDFEDCEEADSGEGAGDVVPETDPDAADDVPDVSDVEDVPDVEVDEVEDVPDASDVEDVPGDVEDDGTGDVPEDAPDVPDVPTGTPRCAELCGVPNGICEDGGIGSAARWCRFGEDCTDCGVRYYDYVGTAECEYWHEDFDDCEWADERVLDGPFAGYYLTIWSGSGPGAVKAARIGGTPYSSTGADVYIPAGDPWEVTALVKFGGSGTLFGFGFHDGCFWDAVGCRCAGIAPVDVTGLSRDYWVTYRNYCDWSGEQWGRRISLDVGSSCHVGSFRPEPSCVTATEAWLRFSNLDGLDPYTRTGQIHLREMCVRRPP